MRLSRTLSQWLFVLVLGGAVGHQMANAPSMMPLASNFTGGGCNIKGNISINSGERIYHVPGQEYYDETRISKWKGERWFCSEQEAQAAGWRRAKR
jgi:hypothetical protein